MRRASDWRKVHVGKATKYHREAREEHAASYAYGNLSLSTARKEPGHNAAVIIGTICA